ncbi:hypothetical protein C1646_753981 [Rhizophagus diaphanus]|nr:hypothetical protein C1646_753981 [Rhizophagus diaphanus] [Rhizophagus sp. MUCL 43196]
MSKKQSSEELGIELDVMESEENINKTRKVKTDTVNEDRKKELEIVVSSIDDILADVGKLTGDKRIIPSDYLVSFKPEESTGAGA